MIKQWTEGIRYGEGQQDRLLCTIHDYKPRYFHTIFLVFPTFIESSLSTIQAVKYKNQKSSNNSTRWRVVAQSNMVSLFSQTTHPNDTNR